MKKFSFIIFICIPFLLFSTESDYQFIGRHLVISYVGCDQAAIENETLLKDKMEEAARASGVTILSSSHHHFQPKGLTQVLLLSESHASIHTYPESGSCFVDLFTCGTSWEMERFEAVLSDYLKPKHSSCKMFLRGKDSQEIEFKAIKL